MRLHAILDFFKPIEKTYKQMKSHVCGYMCIDTQIVRLVNLIIFFFDRDWPHILGSP